jgi:LysR family transcriptional regulator, cyn operon transcriptional activator
MNVEFRHLRYLLAVAQEGHFTRAAEKIFITQSALSQQIQALENEVGTVLVERSKRGVRLTAAGEILCQHAQRILKELEEAKVAIEELEGLQRGELRIGVVQTLNDYLMPALATHFAANHPLIRLLIDELSSDELELRLEKGELQLALGFIPTSNPNIQSELLFEEELVLIMREDHALARHSAIAVHKLDRVPMVMLSNTFCTRRLWEEKALLASAQPQIVMEMNTVSSILSVIEKTGLATVLPQHTLVDGRSQALTSRRLHDPTPTRQVGLLWHRDRFLCSASRAFIAAAQAASQTLTS